jgi:anti-sigma factor RsiW
MNPNQELKLQAYLDGELSGREARDVAEWLSSDSDAKLLFAELQNTKTALKENELPIKLPETREFFWSKIQREIERQEPRPERPAVSVPVWAWLRRYVAPISVGIAAVAALLITIDRSPVGPAGSQLGEVESMLEDMGVYTFRSQADEMTVVWVYNRDQSPVAESDGSATLETQ